MSASTMPRTLPDGLRGILLSGLLYQWGGIVACLAGSAAMLIVSWLITFLLPIAPTVQTQQRTA